MAREDIELNHFINGTFVFKTKDNREMKLTKETAEIEDEILLNDGELKFEASGDDWFVFRDCTKQVYLLINNKENELFFKHFHSYRSKNDLTTLLSTWKGKKIYGYCDGYFDRDHYGVHEHTVEAIGDDWIVARGTDEWRNVTRVYLAYFDKDELESMEKLLTQWAEDDNEITF